MSKSKNMFKLGGRLVNKLDAQGRKIGFFLKGNLDVPLINLEFGQYCVEVFDVFRDDDILKFLMVYKDDNYNCLFIEEVVVDISAMRCTRVLKGKAKEKPVVVSPNDKIYSYRDLSGLEWFLSYKSKSEGHYSGGEARRQFIKYVITCHSGINATWEEFDVGSTTRDVFDGDNITLIVISSDLDNHRLLKINLNTDFTRSLPSLGLKVLWPAKKCSYNKPVKLRNWLYLANENLPSKKGLCLVDISMERPFISRMEFDIRDALKDFGVSISNFTVEVLNADANGEAIRLAVIVWFGSLVCIKFTLELDDKDLRKYNVSNDYTIIDGSQSYNLKLAKKSNAKPIRSSSEFLAALRKLRGCELHLNNMNISTNFKRGYGH